MAQKMYPNKLNFGSMNGTDEKAYKEYKDRVEKIANSFKYDDNRNGYLSYINSGLLDVEEGKKLTAVDVMGTKDIKEIRKLSKNQRRPNRPYGGMYCTNCTKEIIKKEARSL